MSRKKCPPCTSDQIIKVALYLGYEEKRRTRGSHVMLARKIPPHSFTIVDKGEMKTTGLREDTIKALEKNNPGVDVRALIYGKKKARG